jgi:hypothetical protein
MKKILSFITLLVISMSIFAGCGNNANNASTQNTSTTKSSAAQNSTNKTNTQSNDTTKTPGISGEVSSINGTEVTMKLIEVPNMNGGKTPTSADEQNKDKTSPSDGQKPKIETRYTGETKTLKITDGISITSLVKNDNSGTEQDMTEKSISVKDIKVGDRLDVWYTDSNKTTISKINVLSLNKN